MSWDYADTYVAACGQPFLTAFSGSNHERDCMECQRMIAGIDDHDNEENEDGECSDDVDQRESVCEGGGSAEEVARGRGRVQRGD